MKTILDLDTGIDDALALAYALGSPELELIGVTGTYGNVLRFLPPLVIDDALLDDAMDVFAEVVLAAP